MKVLILLLVLLPAFAFAQNQHFTNTDTYSLMPGGAPSGLAFLDKAPSLPKYDRWDTGDYSPISSYTPRADFHKSLYDVSDSTPK